MTEPDGTPLNITGLLDAGGTLRLSGAGDAEWRRITEASLEEYRRHHQAQDYPPSTLHVMAAFEGFIAKWAGIWDARTMIDLGCGIGTALPPYVRNIAGSPAYVGLDPLDENPQRDYPFIRGRLEDLAVRPLDKKFDLALFATSLDHFEDARNALALAAKITGGGHAVIWCGLHDSPLIARNDLSVRIADLCRNNRSFPTRTLAFLGLAILTWPRVAWALARRERALAAGRPLDDLHFHYFTEDRLRALLASAGTIHEFVHCPGTNSVFAAVTLSAETE
ncbi:MAG: hypothetical protein COW30_00855 [Rhodospirillales bacterium CG15_BIG_FIL_POST_REV_8_21_14_020_66_15]|nr:MAG: hypothetical protein COW30_00855 [Rhodospirillales bacterium CG15_BIG_FIL_POST_REV_8_21_14_020_66_15]